MKIRPYRPEDEAALLEIQRKQLLGWFGKEPSRDALAELNSPLNVQTLILEDDNGKIVAAVGAKATVELAMTLAPSDGSLRVLFDDLIRLWGQTILGLHQKGYTDAVVKVGPHIKKWANTLVKRGGFKRLNTESLWFDIEKECADARKTV